jgi:hypothetical protein
MTTYMFLSNLYFTTTYSTFNKFDTDFIILLKISDKFSSKDWIYLKNTGSID